MSVWLIAGREFRAYAGTLSFWIALVVAPLAMAGVMVLASAAAQQPAPAAVRIAAADPVLARSAAVALAEAAAIDGRALVVLPPGAPGPAARMAISRGADGALEVRLTGAPPLSTAGQALFVRTLERDEARGRLAAPSPAARLIIPPAPRGGLDAGRMARFATVMLLWLTLTGSLGMLLQAVVRERGNRSLESLLAAVSPIEIVLGKLAGVGAVSVLVIVAWLGSAAALAPIAPASGGLATMLLRDIADPAGLARAGVIYILAYAFYGLVTVAIGAMARDSAAAQNLVRPMFAVLLAAFFAALAATAGGGERLAWLTLAPPFTPFMLLLQPPGQAWSGVDFAGLGLLVLATGLAGAWAVRVLTLDSGAPWPRRIAAAAPPSGQS